MSEAADSGMTMQRFLDWERAQSSKWEFDGVAPVAMTGGSLMHRLIADSLCRALRARLRPPCRALAGDVKVVCDGRVRYPDVVVACGELDLRQDIVADPVMVCEIVSPSTERVDRFVKLEEYRLTRSIQHYLLLEQSSADGLLFSRLNDSWVARGLRSVDTIPLRALGLEIAMASIYEETGLVEAAGDAETTSS